MGKKYFRNGRLYSQEAFDFSGTRTLAAGTESDLWAGTAATRPQPGGIQLRVISSSAQDDSVKTQRDTVTFAGTMDPATKDKWTCTLGGAIDAGDIARLTLDGINFDTECRPALNTLAARAAEIATSAMSGSWDTWKLTISGGNAAGTETITVQIPGDTGGDAGTATWTYNPPAGRTDAEMAGDLRTALATSTLYDIIGASTFVSLRRKVRGAGVTIVSTADGALSTGQTHPATGTAGQAAWTVTDDGVSAVICERATAGATAGTVASSYSTDVGAASTFTAVDTVTGADADVLAVSDGTTTFSRAVLTAVLADEVAALAALINADLLYVASSALGVITVESATPGVGFTLADASTDNQTADLTVTIAHPVTNGAGTGVQTLRIDYLDGDGVPQFESVTMNGTTRVLTTATDIGAILGISATAVGTTGAAVGTISITNVGNTSTFGTVAIGATQDAAADFTVRSGREGWVTCVDASAGAVATTVKLCSDTNPATGAIVPGAKFTWASGLFGTNPEDLEPEAPYGPFPAGSRVWLTGTSAGGTACVGTLHGYLTQE